VKKFQQPFTRIRPTHSEIRSDLDEREADKLNLTEGRDETLDRREMHWARKGEKMAEGDELMKRWTELEGKEE
jgi:hypothetical protein